MRIAVMLRALDERGGVAVYTRNLLQHLLELNQADEYLLLYRSAGHLGLHAARKGVTERLLLGRSKAVWDQVLVPAAAHQFKADVILHPKFTVPLTGSIPSVMVLHGADWFLPKPFKLADLFQIVQKFVISGG